jgi:DNA polymerase V
MDENLESMADSDGVSVHSGFPNPAVDRRGQAQQPALDLNRLLIRHPNSTYLFRISGHSWADQGIYDGDMAVIDRIRAPRPADLILSRQASGFHLYRVLPDMPLHERPWGVVTAIIHQYD